MTSVTAVSQIEYRRRAASAPTPAPIRTSKTIAATASLEVLTSFGPQDLGDRAALDVVLAHVPLDEMPDVRDVLHGQRLVEPVVLAQLLDHGGVAGALAAGQRADRVARDDEQTGEEDQRRAEED